MTRARKTDGGWLIQGQKVWSSGAHLSDVGELLARTHDDLSLRHKGLTMFLLDMTLPGITVRPLRQMTGNSHFCEVFFDDVFLSDDDLLGGVGAGWPVALTSLNSERDGFAGIDEHLFLRPVPRFIQLVEMLGKGDDPRVRRDVANSYIDSRIVELLAGRIEEHPTAVLDAAGSSMVKLASTSANFELAQRVASVLGPSVTADGGLWGHYSWSRMLLGVFAPRIAGGTDQIQRNLIAERGLGLPREPRDA
jgi:acyl-CoA dehydrogenase